MTQFDRVVRICNGAGWKTLREIETSCHIRYGKHDTQTAISARLRDTAKLAILKLKKESRNNGNTWHYRITKL
jgi:hypothetical protein